MADYIDTIKQTLNELVERRRHIDADIADMRRILARHEGTPGEPPAQVTREPGQAARRGEARAETLELLAAGGYWTPKAIAESRGVSQNAVRAMLRRLEQENPPPIKRDGDGYRLASQNGDAQGSLSVAAEGEQRDTKEGVEDVVGRAPA